MTDLSVGNTEEERISIYYQATSMRVDNTWADAFHVIGKVTITHDEESHTMNNMLRVHGQPESFASREEAQAWANENRSQLREGISLSVTRNWLIRTRVPFDCTAIGFDISTFKI